MLRKGSLVILVSCMAIIGLTACPKKKDDPTCGDGVAEGNEQCDLLDLQNLTCADVVAGSTGSLTCTNLCVYDTSACAACGDGIVQFGEQCDCGTNAANLPAGCPGVNGGTPTNCSATCTRVAYCGDGRTDAPEECDCGTTTPLPTGCTDVNGGANTNCTDICEDVVECNVSEQFGECDALVIGDCCPDAAGVDMQCVPSLYAGQDNMCDRECTDAADCWWDMTCYSAAGVCLYPFCGEGLLIDASFFGACQAPGGTPGLCIPFGRYSDTHDAFGMCFEAGTIAHGDPCPADADLFMTDRDFDGGAAAKMCANGLCYAATGETEGTCYQFCDWQNAYAVAFYSAPAGDDPMPCPTGSNCFPESTIDETTGYRSGDYAACRLSVAVDPDGLTSCSLVTGQLLSNPSQTCADAGFTNGQCVLVNFNDGQGGTVTTYGSVIGACIDGAAAPNLAVWDLCDPANTNQVCPVGTICERPDVFEATPALGERCVPMCDTAHASGTQTHCADLGAVPTGDGTPVCQSMSYLFLPDGPNDTSKTRLGLCGL